MSGFDKEGVDNEFFRDTNIKSNFLCNLGYGIKQNYLKGRQDLNLTKFVRSYNFGFLCVNTSLNSCSINLVSENKNIICYEDKSNPPSDIISILVKESLESASLQVSDISV